MSQNSLLVAQITDMHLFADADQCLLGLQTIESFRAILKQINALKRRPDLLLLTGDLSQDGTADSYETLRELLMPLGIPAYWIPGNHDCPTTMETILSPSRRLAAGQAALISPQKSFQTGGWQILLLSSWVRDRVYGHLSSESLSWLDQELSQSSPTPTLIALHHPPFQVGSDWMNEIGLRNADELFAVCDRHSHVQLVLFGHIHQEFSRQRNQVHYFGTPSTCIQFKPNSADFSLDQQQPGFRLVTLYPDGNWHTQVERIVHLCQPDLAAVGY